MRALAYQHCINAQITVQIAGQVEECLPSCNINTFMKFNKKIIAINCKLVQINYSMCSTYSVIVATSAVIVAVVSVPIMPLLISTLHLITVLLISHA